MSTPGSINQLLIGAAGAAGAGSEISRSLRFNSADSAYLSRTPGVAGNRKTWTWAGWVKRSAIGTAQNHIFVAGAATSSNTTYIRLAFNSNDTFFIGLYTVSIRTTTAVFRDPSAWYHIVVAMDTTNATETDRCIIYVNGIRQSVTGSITQNDDYGINATQAHHIGNENNSGYLNGYLADIHFIDGQALDPTSFGEFDTNGVWQPKAYSGSYGTNGFHLPFSDNSTAAALGTDTSGNGNDWTANNLAGAELPATSNVSVTAFPGVTTVEINNIILPVNADNINTLLRLPYFQNTNVAVANRIYNNFVLGSSVGDSVTISWSDLPAISAITLLMQRVTTTDSEWTITGDISGSGTTGTFTFYTFPTSATSGSFTLTTTNSSPGLSIQCISFEPYGLSERTDSFVDSPVNNVAASDTGAGGEIQGNYCTQNPLDNNGLILSNGNLEIIDNTTGPITEGTFVSYATFAVSSGKWYWEYENTKTGTIRTVTGITPAGRGFPASYIGATADEYGFTWTGTKRNANLTPPWGVSLSSAGQILMTALDLDAGKIWWGLDGVWFESGDPAAGLSEAFSGISGTYVPAFQKGTTTTGTVFTGAHVNFGQRPFTYTAPSGFKALCTTNLPDPVVAQPSTVMDVKLYTGTSSTGTVTVSGLAFSPDLVWVKNRTNINRHGLADTIRGVNNSLASNLADGELTTQTDLLTSFNSDGFTVGGDAGQYGWNYPSASFAAWCWDAGSSTVTNTQGSITSTVRANASAGFSIVTYTGNGVAGATVGHGLGVSPSFIIVKTRNTTGNGWRVYHSALGNTKYIQLDSTDIAYAYTDWNNTTPSSSVITLGASSPAPTNTNENTYVAYCFAPVAGYSSFGSYTGNNSTDGPFVYTGFRPRWILIKLTDSVSTYPWEIYDTARSTYNVMDVTLAPNTANSEPGQPFPGLIDVTANGFKIRSANATSYINYGAGTYIYAAFAENPFKYARAR